MRGEASGLSTLPPGPLGSIVAEALELKSGASLRWRQAFFSNAFLFLPTDYPNPLDLAPESQAIVQPLL